MPVRIVDDGKGNDSVELATVSNVIHWLLDWLTSLFVVAFNDGMAFVSRLELCTVDSWIVDDEVISVRIVEMLGWLLVTYSDVNFSVIIVGCINVLAVVIGWTDDMSKIDVITFELWSEIGDDVVVSLAIICIDDGTDELSVALDILLIAVAASSVSDEGVVISMEVAYERDVDDNDEYSLEFDALWVTLIVFSLVLLGIPFVVAEIYCVVDSSDSIDEVRSFWEINGVVNIGISDDIGSLFPVVADAVDNVFVFSIEESV